MPRYDFTAPRLFLDAALAPDRRVPLDGGQANYLLSVLRLKAGAEVLVFNGRDGEWRARIAPEGRRGADLVVAERVREQTAPGDVSYLFAPLKSGRLDYMAQKAVEMGASVLQPVRTRRTQPTRINLDRLRANGIEAAEQCGILAVPEVREELPLADALRGLEPERLLVFCDEDAPVASPVAALGEVRDVRGLALLIGPEGGFDDEERRILGARANTVRLSLGPRILRADTAAVAALAVVQAVLGDWR